MVIVMERAWHGRTLGTLAATGSAKASAGFGPAMTGFIRVPYNDLAAIEQVAATHNNVVAVLLDRGSAHPLVQAVWNNLPLEKGDEMPAATQIDLSRLLPEDRRYFTYMGSLTTPPCSEGVQWIVMRQPVTVAPEQIELFARIYPMNARPLQAASGRRIMQSN